MVISDILFLNSFKTRSQKRLVLTVCNMWQYNTLIYSTNILQELGTGVAELELEDIFITLEKNVSYLRYISHMSLQISKCLETLIYQVPLHNVSSFCGSVPFRGTCNKFCCFSCPSVIWSAILYSFLSSVFLFLLLDFQSLSKSFNFPAFETCRITFDYLPLRFLYFSVFSLIY